VGDPDVSRRLAYSRWRRLPGVFRSGERRQVGPGDDPERLTLYLPARLLDLATELAGAAGAPSAQAYCEALLGRALQAAAEARAAERHAVAAERGAPLEGLDAIANDPDYLAEWSQSHAARGPESDEEFAYVDGKSDDHIADAPPAAVRVPRAVEVEVRLDALDEPFRLVLHHAALSGEPPPAVLASLRAGIAVEPDAARELIEALEVLGDRLQGATVLDRRLALALHRLALESQILLTETWPGLASDPLQVEVLRRVQDLVDCVFADAGPEAGVPASDPAPAPEE
jgi:hypothetical protein